jgi:hypothetical protein
MFLQLARTGKGPSGGLKIKERLPALVRDLFTFSSKVIKIKKIKK